MKKTLLLLSVLSSLYCNASSLEDLIYDFDNALGKKGTVVIKICNNPEKSKIDTLQIKSPSKEEIYCEQLSFALSEDFNYTNQLDENFLSLENSKNPSKSKRYLLKSGIKIIYNQRTSNLNMTMVELISLDKEEAGDGNHIYIPNIADFKYETVLKSEKESGNRMFASFSFSDKQILLRAN